MEYYKVLDASLFSYNNFSEDAHNYIAISSGSCIFSSAIKIKNEIVCCEARNSFITTSYDVLEYLYAFATSSKYGYDIRDGITQKQYLEGILNATNSSLNNANHFKRITAKEYYSLLK